MSSFYRSMDLNKQANLEFKAMKRAFKEGKRCAHCGNKYKPSKMTVDHIIPIYRYNGSPFDTSNWQVLCIPCHQKKSRAEQYEQQQAEADYKARKLVERETAV